MTFERCVEALAEIAISAVSPEWAIARSARILHPYLATFDGDKTDERLRIALAFADAMKDVSADKTVTAIQNYLFGQRGPAKW